MAVRTPKVKSPERRAGLKGLTAGGRPPRGLQPGYKDSAPNGPLPHDSGANAGKLGRSGAPAHAAAQSRGRGHRPVTGDYSRSLRQTRPNHKRTETAPGRRFLFSRQT